MNTIHYEHNTLLIRISALLTALSLTITALLIHHVFWQESVIIDLKKKLTKCEKGKERVYYRTDFSSVLGPSEPSLPLSPLYHP